MINIKNLDPKKPRWIKMLSKNIIFHYTGYVTVKNLSCPTSNSVNLSYLIFDKINEHIEKRNGNKYLTLFPTDKNRYILKKYEELLNKIRDLIGSITNMMINN